MVAEHDHDQVDDAEQPEPDEFHDEHGQPLVDDVEGLAEFGAECWEAGVDPDELGAYLRAL